MSHSHVIASIETGRLLPKVIIKDPNCRTYRWTLKKIPEALSQATECLSYPPFFDKLLTAGNRRRSQAEMKRGVGRGWISNISKLYGSIRG